MRVPSILSAVILLAWVGFSVGEEVAPPIAAPAPTGSAGSATPSGLDLLIKQLSSPDWRVREAAQTSLIAVGDDALKPMQQLATSSTDPAVRQGAQAVVRGIELARALQPTLVTLKFKTAPAKQVYDALSAQAGAPWIVSPPDLFQTKSIDPLTIDVKHVPLWQVINQLADQTDLMVDVGTLEMKLGEARHHGRRQRDPVSISGPFLVTADYHTATRSVDRLQVFVDPRIPLLSYQMGAEIDDAADPQPQNLQGLVRRPRQRDPIIGNFRPAMGNSFSVRLDSAEPAARLRGTIRAVVATREETIQFNGIAQPKHIEKKLGPRQVVVDVTCPKPDRWEVRVTASNTDPPTPGTVEMRTKVLNAAGEIMVPDGQGSQGSREQIEFHMGLPAPPPIGAAGPPDKLILTFPLEAQEVQIPFEFEFAK